MGPYFAKQETLDFIVCSVISQENLRGIHKPLCTNYLQYIVEFTFLFYTLTSVTLLLNPLFFTFIVLMILYCIIGVECCQLNKFNVLVIIYNAFITH